MKIFSPLAILFCILLPAHSHALTKDIYETWVTQEQATEADIADLNELVQLAGFGHLLSHLHQPVSPCRLDNLDIRGDVRFQVQPRTFVNQQWETEKKNYPPKDSDISTTFLEEHSLYRISWEYRSHKICIARGAYLISAAVTLIHELTHIDQVEHYLTMEHLLLSGDEYVKRHLQSRGEVAAFANAAKAEEQLRRLGMNPMVDPAPIDSLDSLVRRYGPLVLAERARQIQYRIKIEEHVAKGLRKVNTAEAKKELELLNQRVQLLRDALLN